MTGAAQHYALHRPAEPWKRRTWSEQRRPAEDRFWSYVEPDLNSGCWLWAGTVRGNGYPSISVNGSTVPAHRFAWELQHGQSIPPGLLACHRCDTPTCVNPHHIFLGTQRDNSADRQRKGRGVRGERVIHAKLTADDVVEIRRLRRDGEGLKALAKRYGVDPSAIRAAALRATWKHVKDPADA